MVWFDGWGGDWGLRGDWGLGWGLRISHLSNSFNPTLQLTILYIIFHGTTNLLQYCLFFKHKISFTVQILHNNKLQISSMYKNNNYKTVFYTIIILVYLMRFRYCFHRFIAYTHIIIHQTNSIIFGISKRKEITQKTIWIYLFIFIRWNEKKCMISVST